MGTFPAYISIKNVYFVKRFYRYKQAPRTAHVAKLNVFEYLLRPHIHV